MLASTAQASIVVLTEDDESIRELLVEALEELGYRVRPAGTGDEALQRCVEEPRPHLLLLDWSLPDCTGGEVLESLALLGVRELPVAVMTGNTAALQQCEVAAKIHKPFDLETLREVVEHLIGPAVAVSSARGSGDPARSEHQPSGLHA